MGKGSYRARRCAKGLTSPLVSRVDRAFPNGHTGSGRPGGEEEVDEDRGQSSHSLAVVEGREHRLNSQRQSGLGWLASWGCVGVSAMEPY